MPYLELSGKADVGGTGSSADFNVIMSDFKVFDVIAGGVLQRNPNAGCVGLVGWLEAKAA